MTDAPSLLLVDDDVPLLQALTRSLQRRGLTVHAASSYDEALVLAREHRPTRAVLDVRMPDHSGIELLAALRELLPELQAVMVTGYGSIAGAVDAVRLGALDYVTKPADADRILDAFERSAAPIGQAPTPSYESAPLAQAEWEHIQRVLRDVDGNISKAARILGLHRRTLQRKLQRGEEPSER